MLRLTDEEQMYLDDILVMSPEEFEKYVDNGEHCAFEVVALFKHAAQLNDALESACEQRNDCCPIDEISYYGAYPEWCNVQGNIDDGVTRCRHVDESTMECWKRFYLNELVWIEEPPAIAIDAPVKITVEGL